MNNIHSLAEKRLLHDYNTRIDTIYAEESDVSGTSSDVVNIPNLIDLVTKIIKVYARASKHNWNGEDAEPISLAAYHNATIFLQSLPPGIVLPDVQPDNEGYFDFEWYHDRRSFSIYVGPSKVFLWAAYFSMDDRSSGRFTYKNKVPEEFVAKIQGVYDDAIV